MSLDVTLTAKRIVDVYSANITHNLGEMAAEAGIYQILWRPEELAVRNARDLIVPLTQGLLLLKTDPERFKKFDAPNGWGVYENFVEFVEKYLYACAENPDAKVHACR
jgi:hypothetical protein